MVDVMDSGDAAHLSLMKRPDLGVTFTKLHCWTLTHYSKCVFMDADTLVRSKRGRVTEKETRRRSSLYVSKQPSKVLRHCVSGAVEYR